MAVQSNAPGADLNLQPWLDYATVAVPDNHLAVLWWAEYMWTSNDSYRMAMSRIADHFLTEIDFPELDTDEENDYRELFSNELGYRMAFKAVAEECLAYGTVIAAVHQPFFRRMVCQECGREEPYDRAQPKLKMTPAAPYLLWNRSKACAGCGSMNHYKCVDRPNPDLKKIKIIRHTPRDVEMAFNPYTEGRIVRLKPNTQYFADLRTCAEIYARDTPIELLETAAQNRPFRFEEDSVLVITLPTLSGIHMRGWGMPASIASFRTAWLYQMYNKADQAVAADYTLGMRMISPAPTKGGADPIQLKSTTNFAENMRAVIKNHRKDPTRMYVVPHAMEYQFLGGEGATLIQPDKLKFRQQEFLNGMGVPAEFYQMNLSVQAAPMALRLFENAWQVIPALYNQLLGFIMDQVADVMNLKPQRAVMRRTTIADDSERKAVLGQLMAANQISAQTFLEAFGINAYAEVRKVYRQQAYTQKIQAEFAEKAQKDQELGIMQQLTAAPTPSMLAQQQQGGQPPSGPGANMVGGGPAGAAGQPGGGLLEMGEQAEQIAQQLLPMDEASRKTQLKSIRESDKNLHALVTSALERLRSQARAQGGQQVIQQMAGQQPVGQ